MTLPLQLETSQTTDITKIIDKETIEYLKANKHEITQELLSALREHGNAGKQIALDVLDLEKDNEQYYLDAFGKRMSFNGNRRLKKSFTKMNLYPIHVQEIETCARDIHYFKDNYVKIKTKNGVNFPDLREYQNNFIDSILPDEHEDNVGLMGRQCCSAGTAVEVTKDLSTSTVSIEHLFNECKDEASNLEGFCNETI